MENKFRYEVYREGSHHFDDAEDGFDSSVGVIKCAKECHAREPNVHFWVDESRCIYSTDEN